MKALLYPGADRSQWFGDKFNGLIMGDLDKILLHSTETEGFPGYGGGASAPTMTINPWPGERRIRQHFNLNESARALVNPAGTSVSENKDEVCQIEIIGYSDRSLGVPRRKYLPNLDRASLDWIAGILVFIMREWSVPNTWATPFPWPLYPSSYGRTSSRMTSVEYDTFTGILGHLHASGNTHGDPSLDVRTLRALVTDRLAPAPVPPTSPKGTDMRRLVRLKDTDPVWVSDLIHRRHIADQGELALVRGELKAAGLATTTSEVTDLRPYGAVVGNDPLAGKVRLVNGALQ